MQPAIKKNDKLAKRLIYTVSILIFAAILLLDQKKVKVPYPFDFDVHVFAMVNAIINSIVACLLVAALIAVKQKNIVWHKRFVLSAILCSVLFLLSYIMHHLWAQETSYGGEGAIKIVYYIILISHIILAAVILPFILFTAYRGLSGDYQKHKKIARYTWPLWFYVAITGVVVYLMISPYYV